MCMGMSCGIFWRSVSGSCFAGRVRLSSPYRRCKTDDECLVGKPAARDTFYAKELKDLTVQGIVLPGMTLEEQAAVC